MNKATKAIKNRILLCSAIASLCTLAVTDSRHLVLDTAPIASKHAQVDDAGFIPVSHPVGNKKPCPNSPERAGDSDKDYFSGGSVYRWLVGDYKAPSFHFIDFLEFFK